MWSFNKSEDVNLLCQKGVYPYSHIKNFEVFEETCLPPKEAFRHDLTGEDISSEKYEFAQRVWSSMGCNTWGIIMIFTCIKIFCSWLISLNSHVCLKNYQLDPAHYYTVPGLVKSSLKPYMTLRCISSLNKVCVAEFP